MGCQWSGDKADFHSLQDGGRIDPVSLPCLPKSVVLAFVGNADPVLMNSACVAGGRALAPEGMARPCNAPACDSFRALC